MSNLCRSGRDSPVHPGPNSRDIQTRPPLPHHGTKHLVPSRSVCTRPWAARRDERLATTSRRRTALRRAVSGWCHGDLVDAVASAAARVRTPCGRQNKITERLTMKMPLAPLMLAIVSMSASTPALAIEQREFPQREFPTDDAGTIVTYLDAAGLGHPTGCIVVITAALPKIVISFTIFSNNKFTVGIALPQSTLKVTVGSEATVKVNSIYIYSKVTDAVRSDGNYIIDLAPLDDVSIDTVYDAMKQITHNPIHIDVVADGAQMPSVSIPPKPGVATALTACQQYMIKQFKFRKVP